MADEPFILPAAGAGELLTVRVVTERARRHSVRRGLVQPLEVGTDRGAMVSVHRRHGSGYCATADLSEAGLRRAADCASERARLVESCGVFDGVDLISVMRRFAGATGGAAKPSGTPDRGPREIVELLRAESAAMQIDARIVHTAARLAVTDREQVLFVGGDKVCELRHRYVESTLEATAADGAESQTRTLAGQYNGNCRQAPARDLLDCGLAGAGARVADEAMQLLGAPDCPSGRFDLLLAPDQMMLQIHESIGHPLELDRILGDERNFAGTSFVTLEMFGSYRYGSPLLNVTFDPTVDGELASYDADDEGEPAERVHLIRDGVLVAPLGGALSRARAAALGHRLAGTANSRSVGWHRPPIDRMGNINLEPGDTPLERMIASVERGVLMRTNASWSIDDSRNKFQFGCEWGQLIEGGRLGGVVRNPNYRGRSTEFWRSLAAVGDRASFEVMGTPFCGKGEPGQVIRVGHAAPACLFRDVDVFGGHR